MGLLTASRSRHIRGIWVLFLGLMALAPPFATAEDDAPVVLVVGDSISAAFGLAESDGWVSLAQQALADDYPGIQLVNASISGDTTAGGLRRLPAALERFEPDLVIIELGGNDGLRAYSVAAMRDNLIGMAEAAQESGAATLFLGMMIPSNYGPAYTNAFTNAFTEAAEATDSQLVPFFLEPIAEDRDYFQRDGIHPTAGAQPLMLEHALPMIRQSLELATAL